MPIGRTAKLRLYVATVLLLAGFALALWAHQRRVTRDLLQTEPAVALASPGLLRHATRIAKPVYRQRCASCHGDLGKTPPTRGVADLRKRRLLYGRDPVDLERTILYGIRSGHPKARNVTDMPGFVATAQLTADDDRDVVEYILSVAGQTYDEAAALRGREVFFAKGNCFDCHGSDARGVADYGTPSLTGPTWLFGGDRRSLYSSVANGHHGKCPAWIGVLAPVQVRALMLYLNSAPQIMASAP